ncbi:hypothetical protein UY3_00164 [Chelonia mydas]|uniref:Uncharacterized protein n=1 Tax=Chelonia mydas TaxID=8469 RepID=M7CCV6_CHEMY|nr:hypothetical protein UY3_00164 [Chelonia mydas]
MIGTTPGTDIGPGTTATLSTMDDAAVATGTRAGTEVDSDLGTELQHFEELDGKAGHSHIPGSSSSSPDEAVAGTSLGPPLPDSRAHLELLRTRAPNSCGHFEDPPTATIPEK